MPFLPEDVVVDVVDVVVVVGCEGRHLVTWTHPAQEMTVSGTMVQTSECFLPLARGLQRQVRMPTSSLHFPRQMSGSRT